MIRKYSNLKQPIYILPRMDDRKKYTEEQWRQMIDFVVKSRQDLIKKKLLPRGGKIPKTDANKFIIVSKEPTDSSKWRITNFVFNDGKPYPTGHIVFNSLTVTDANYTNYGSSVEENLTGVDWEKWANA